MARVACFGLMMLSRIGPHLRRAFGAMQPALHVAILAWLVDIGVASASGQLLGPV